MRPGESRRQRQMAGGDTTTKEQDVTFIQKFHHRGAFYMDEDELAMDKDDVRNRAAEYSRAHTASDVRITKSMPKIMQVKNFGLAGHSTKYKGLAAEDTTGKTSSYIPIVERKKRGNSRY